MVPEGWEEKRLDALTSVGITYGVVKPGDARAGGVPFVRGGDFPNGKIKINTLRTISPQISAAYKRTILEGGEILVSLVGYPGATTIVPDILSGANIARQAALVRTNDKVERHYLFQFLRSQVGQKRMLAQTLGSAQQVINLKDLKSINISIPPLAEQRKIAEILSVWDRAIEVSEALLATARIQKRALMQALLTGKRRFPEFEGQEWKEVLLGDVTTKIGSGVTPKGGRNSYLDEGIPLIRSQNVGWGELMMDDVAFISQDQHNSMSGSKIQNGDVLLNITGASIGRSSIYLGENNAANVNQHVCIVRTNSTVDPSYINAFLLSYYGQKQIDQFQAGGNRQGLNFKQIGSFKLPCPSISEQKKIAETLSAHGQEIRFCELEVQHLRTEKKALMQQLLTGKRRVTV